MSDEPFPFDPDIILKRGEFPKHFDVPQPLLTADEARQRARQRLLNWRATHGD